MSFWDARDRIAHLSNVYRLQSFTGRNIDPSSTRMQRELAEIDTPEPDEELEDSDLGDNERRAAIDRERLRRDKRD